MGRLPGTLGPEATEFIGHLQLDLARLELELPGFPEVTLSLQQLLADEAVSMDRVLRVVSSEPLLAARIIRLASSAALNPRGLPVTDLRNAVIRLGFNALRAAAAGFAITQVQLAQPYKDVLPQLTQLKDQSVSMAAAACVVARHSQRVSPDTALLAGLMTAVGKICLVARSASSSYMQAHPEVFQEVMRDWHAEVARELLTRWGVSEDIIEAMHGYQTHRAAKRGLFMLTDVLAVAEVLTAPEMTTEMRKELLESQLAARRIGLQPQDCVTLLNDLQAELESLRGALAP